MNRWSTFSYGWVLFGAAVMAAAFVCARLIGLI